MCMGILPAYVCVHYMCGGRSHLIKGLGNCPGCSLCSELVTVNVLLSPIPTVLLVCVGPPRWAAPLIGLQDGAVLTAS